MVTQEQRPLYQIAADIRKHWPKPYFGAVPYIAAMRDLDKVSDMYISESASSIVIYFLSNASSWRGPEAKRIKAELNAMVKRK